MTKKKKLINALIFIGGLVVFLFYYFEDKGDMNKKDKEQVESAVSAADSMLNVLNDEEFDFEEDSIVEDSL